MENSIKHLLSSIFDSNYCTKTNYLLFDYYEEEYLLSNSNDLAKAKLFIDVTVTIVI